MPCGLTADVRIMGFGRRDGIVGGLVEFRHVASSAMVGNMIVVRVPAPGSLSIVIVAPIRADRSRVFARPW